MCGRDGSMSSFIVAEAEGEGRRETQQLLLGRSRWGLQGRWAALIHPSIPPSLHLSIPPSPRHVSITAPP